MPACNETCDGGWRQSDRGAHPVHSKAVLPDQTVVQDIIAVKRRFQCALDTMGD